jgi:hypothetical protein
MADDGRLARSASFAWVAEESALRLSVLQRSPREAARLHEEPDDMKGDR